MRDAQDDENDGMKALTEGRRDEAIALLSRAAAGYQETGALPQAMGLFSSVALLHRNADELDRALAMTERALALNVPPRAGGMALINCASVLDRVGDKRARGIWLLAAQGFAETKPMMKLGCLAHAAGAEVALGSPTAMRSVRDIVGALPDTAPAALKASVLGAIGESARDHGVPFLAQAVWVMAGDPSAFTYSNQAHWALLVEKTGWLSDLSIPLCVLGLGATLVQPPEHQQTMVNALNRVVEHCAHARGLDTEAMALKIRESVTALGTLPHQLRALVKTEQWLLGSEPLPV